MNVKIKIDNLNIEISEKEILALPTDTSNLFSKAQSEREIFWLAQKIKNQRATSGENKYENKEFL